MKLTKYMKEGIVRAIMNDVPAIDEAKMQKDIQAAVVAKMSATVLAAYKNCPKSLKEERVYGYQVGTRISFNIITGDVKLDKILEPFTKESDKRDEVQRRLQGAVNGCSTLKQLETLLPEFKKYFPTEAQPTKNLPMVVNVVADLSKLGWPKK